MKKLEVWGGLECTYNRVGESYNDQCEKNGHNHRFSDLALFVDLGIKKIRYPCLWEKVAPLDLERCDWSHLDERLTEFKRLNQKVIAGFLHHGSGPKYTSLIDPDFPEKLATYARKFIFRYPWINDFTPVNEINTTARFSCLYGHWYPHLKSDLYYLKAMLLQCKGTILAMREIKRVNPNARLIQTDDIGECQSTEILSYQRNFENERRWLGFDLLCGSVNKHHPLYTYILDNGIREDELLWFTENNFQPDVIGVNHYHLSNRFLDHRLDLYPKEFHGGNGIHSYADVVAIDSGQAEIISPEEILKETWKKYQIPMAITECHTRGHREAQMRWFNNIWKSAKKLQANGIEIEAVTAWSLLGTFDWNSLCTKSENFYEPGVFDLRHPQHIPTPTALSNLIKNLASGKESNIPVLDSEATWDTPRRILWAAKEGAFSPLYHRNDVRPVLITGKTGTLGQALAKACGARNISYRLLDRRELDITDQHSIEEAIAIHNPWAIINAAGFVNVDAAEKDQDLCFKANVEGAVNLAHACSERSIKLVNFSSDLVFDGNQDKAYFESHEVSPLSIYGKSKAECEKRVIEVYPNSLIIRTSSFFGPWDDFNFITKTLNSLLRSEKVLVPDDIYISPTYVPDLAHECLNLLIDGEAGILHLTNEGEVTWHEFARMTAEKAQAILPINPTLIIGRPGIEFNFTAKRPVNSVLKSERHRRLPSLIHAIDRYLNEAQISGNTLRS